MKRAGPYHRWTPEQDRLLATLAGTMPVSTVLVRVNEAGPARTKEALLDRAGRRGIDTRPFDALLATREPGAPHPEWTRDEEQAIRAWAGKAPVGEIVARLNERFLTRRTASAVRNRATHLGVSLDVRGRYLTAVSVAREIRVGPERVIGWIDGGLLHAERPGGSSRGSAWLIEPSELERFLRAHPHVVEDWRCLPPGRWRTFMRLLMVRSPWFSTAEVRHRIDVPDRVLHVWLASGFVPGAKRVGSAKSAHWLVPSSAVATIEELARGLRAASEEVAV